MSVVFVGQDDEGDQDARDWHRLIIEIGAIAERVLPDDPLAGVCRIAMAASRYALAWRRVLDIDVVEMVPGGMFGPLGGGHCDRLIHDAVARHIGFSLRSKSRWRTECHAVGSPGPAAVGCAITRIVPE